MIIAMKDGYTIIVISKKGERYQFFIRKRLFILLVALFAFLLVTVIGTTIFYSSLYKEALKGRYLQMENARLRKENAKIAELARRLKELEDYKKRISEMLGLKYSPPPPDIGLILSEEKEVERAGERETYTASVETLSNTLEATEELPVVDEFIPSGMPVKGVISRSFSEEHPAVDIVAPLGSPVVATASGIVLRASYDQKLGNCIVIDHNGMYRTLYGHLDRMFVKPGDKVKKGEIIGSLGTTGLSTGPHLHYEVLLRGVPMDPLLFMQR